MRALASYWSGLLSIMPHGCVLNFWRATEASVAAAREARPRVERLFATLPAGKTKAIWAEVADVNYELPSCCLANRCYQAASPKSHPAKSLPS